jgi:hypothetical protein
MLTYRSGLNGLLKTVDSLRHILRHKELLSGTPASYASQPMTRIPFGLAAM